MRSLAELERLRLLYSNETHVINDSMVGASLKALEKLCEDRQHFERFVGFVDQEINAVHFSG
jgi:hypothetical protein